MDIWTIIYILLIGGIIVGTVFLVLGVSKDDSTNNNNVSTSSNKNIESKGVFVPCKNSFDCGPGLFCDIRDNPTTGVCVIAPGGACHMFGGRDDVCYRGYYCDKEDGTCLKI